MPGGDGMHSRTAYLEGEGDNLQKPLLGEARQDSGGAGSSTAPSAPPLPGKYASATTPPEYRLPDEAVTSAEEPEVTGFQASFSGYRPASGPPGVYDPEAPQPVTIKELEGDQTHAIQHYPAATPRRSMPLPPNTHMQGPVLVVSRFGDFPELVTCRRCHYTGPSVSYKEVGLCTWLSSLGLCLLGCGVIFWLPCCCDSSKDTVHRCARCQTELGRHRF